MQVERVSRQSAPAVIVDDDCRVLLIAAVDPATSGPRFWVTPGGEVEESEEIVTAAGRELWEETGLERTAEELGQPVAFANGDFEFGGRLISTVDWFFPIRTAAFDLDDAGWTEHERQMHVDWRWWTCADLDTTGETVFPAGLADLVRALYTGERDPSMDPVELPWTRG